MAPGSASISRLADNISQHPDLSCAWANHAQQRSDGGSLAGAIETKETVYLTGLHAYVDRIYGKYLTEAFRELIRFDREGHTLSVPQCRNPRTFFQTRVFQFQTKAKSHFPVVGRSHEVSEQQTGTK